MLSFMTENDLPNLILLDSNILIYSIDSSEKEKHVIAKKILEECWMGKCSYVLSIQNISEFFVNATNKVAKPLSKEQGQKIVKRILSFNNFIKIVPSQDTLKRAIDIVISHNVPYWDALIAATMLENKISQIYTENTADFNIPGITPINPFKNRSVKV